MLFRADGKYRSKIGISQRRARNVLGSIDFQAGVLTLVSFTMPDDPTKHPYMNNMWGVPHADPYTGDVANSYNDGPPAPGQEGHGAVLRDRVALAGQGAEDGRVAGASPPHDPHPGRSGHARRSWPKKCWAWIWRRSARRCCPLEAAVRRCETQSYRNSIRHTPCAAGENGTRSVPDTLEIGSSLLDSALRRRPILNRQPGHAHEFRSLTLLDRWLSPVLHVVV